MFTRTPWQYDWLASINCSLAAAHSDTSDIHFRATAQHIELVSPYSRCDLLFCQKLNAQEISWETATLGMNVSRKLFIIPHRKPYHQLMEALSRLDLMSLARGVLL